MALLQFLSIFVRIKPTILGAGKGALLVKLEEDSLMKQIDKAIARIPPSPPSIIDLSRQIPSMWVRSHIGSSIGWSSESFGLCPDCFYATAWCAIFGHRKVSAGLSIKSQEAKPAMSTIGSDRSALASQPTCTPENDSPNVAGTENCCTGNA